MKKKTLRKLAVALPLSIAAVIGVACAVQDYHADAYPNPDARPHPQAGPGEQRRGRRKRGPHAHAKAQLFRDSQRPGDAQGGTGRVHTGRPAEPGWPEYP